VTSIESNIKFGMHYLQEDLTILPLR